jgi:hypothetical protein
VTREHLFFVPFIFLLGVVAGSLMARARLVPKGASSPEGAPARRVGARGLLVPLVAFVVLFVVTHLVGTHGGAKAVEQTLGGQALFDQQASLSATEVHARIDAFGQAGRAAYARMTFTQDLLFPLVLFVFLVQLLRFIAERGGWEPDRRRLPLVLPVAWLLTDLAENATIYQLLTSYPVRHDFLAGALGPLTYLKFTLLVASVALAALLSLPRPPGRKSRADAFLA